MSGEIGHNSIGPHAREQLRSYVERIERLEEEKEAILADIKDVYAEAKASGFNTKVLREVVRIRAKDPNEVSDFRALVDLYMNVFGMSREEATEATGVLD